MSNHSTHTSNPLLPHPSSAAETRVTPSDSNVTRPHTATSEVCKGAATLGGSGCPRSLLMYTSTRQAFRTILLEEGYAGFARGAQARMLIHAPSVAICWTTYETIKHTLERLGLLEW